MSFKSKIQIFHDKYYKLLLVLPLLILLFSFGYMFYYYKTNGDFFKKDISLTGGTTITVYEKLDITQLQLDLGSKLQDLNIREISDLTSGEQKAVIIETTTEGTEAKKIVETYLGYTLVEGENSSFEFTGASLSESFYKQLVFALLFAFVFMAIVVLIMFKSFVPSAAVILSAFADIFMTLIVVDIAGIKMSTAGIIAFLMLIGYSVDTDILLTNRILRRTDNTLNRRIFNSFKTGITMTLTSFFGILTALFIVKSISPVLTQIFTVLTIGLLFDIFNTWVTNVSLLKWYVLKKKK
jgi:preprotein translocase subunit SecF